MISVRMLAIIACLATAGSLAGCGKDEIRSSCDEIKPYQTVVPGKRIVVPEGLDPLDEYKEMPIPKAQTEPRPEGAKCIEWPPSVRTGASG